MIIEYKRAVQILMIIIPLVAGGCNKERERGELQPNGKESLPPVITENSKSILFTWRESSGEFKSSTNIRDIPEGAKSLVIVRDLNKEPPPEDKVWVADLTVKDKKGNYPVKLYSRDLLEAIFYKGEGIYGKRSVEQVVFYMSPYCPICKKAESWLKENNIPFIKKDVESNPEYAKELQQKAIKQGISVTGVPVFEIEGKLIQGFDPIALKKMIFK